MPAAPHVSVILPTCNRREQTRACLDALRQQTYDRFEVIVIDDCSSDDTPQMLRDFADEHRDLQLRVIRNASNLGANASRNRGMAASSAELLAFLDSDCLAEPTWLDRLVEAFDEPSVAAATGLVTDPPPGNIYELCFKGTHRIGTSGPTNRLIAGNMAVRRTRLAELTFDENFRDATRASGDAPDTSFSGRCDEEGIAIQLTLAGHRLVAQPEAVVLHDHRYDRRSFFRQAFHGGRAAAELVRHYKLPHRLDMLLFMFAYAALIAAVALSWWTLWPFIAPALLLLIALAAIAYNDVARKGKTITETIRSFPVLVAYYHVRLLGYMLEMLTRR